MTQPRDPAANPKGKAAGFSCVVLPQSHGGLPTVAQNVAVRYAGGVPAGWSVPTYPIESKHVNYPNNPILVRGFDAIELRPYQNYRATSAADLIQLWQRQGGGQNSVLFPTPLGWHEVREFEDGDGAVLLFHPNDYFLTLVADPLAWWEDALVIKRVTYTENGATEEAEELFIDALERFKGNPI